MSRLEAIGEHVRENRSGMFVDLVFAMTWVTAVSVVFEWLEGPRWAYYLAMLAGVLAYYGFFWSLEAARGSG
ncbi:hypothetical protein HUG10_14130 [Halorarum halophilum]|uniref:DUF8119 domain-containing protein n=1 Tax=Halorarum halophilum TaxID=2743090 RepID=A0A7D5H1M2_9EURY|nr:hypothetical protein [Halobaculum halophilum]QLG28613.1 hypothetical protein HUG10_14130 [Halobaculum halophilum]